MRFEWDLAKANRNAHKHRITFDEAATCFYDPHQVAYYDPDHSDDEDREVLVAHSDRERLLIVSYTLRKDTIRINLRTARYAPGST